MLCHLCHTFLTDFLNGEFETWKRVEEGLYTYKHSNYAETTAAANAGCEACQLFNAVREKQIAGYQSLSPKWHAQACSIDCKDVFYKEDATRVKHTEMWTFSLVTVLPNMSILDFEVFDPRIPSVSEARAEKLELRPYAVSASILSNRAIAIARSWIEDCLNRHPSCAQKNQTTFPTRIIDIGAFSSSVSPRLQVNKGHQGRYVTLSHCWGAGNRLMLTKRNLEKFQRGIPFEQLPQTFRDVIRLVAALGERYLWIDALCILQDDKEDWNREAASMCRVFENAVFSISALNAESGESGVVHQRVPLQARSSGIPFRLRKRLATLEEALSSSKLETRAWCLQERLLSPRILHIAPEQMHWECHTCVFSENTPASERSTLVTGREFTGLHGRTLPSIGDNNHAQWLHLVEGYSGRSLTKPSDRLPAISGLAEKATKKLHLSGYLCGLWLDDLHPGLVWKRSRSGLTKSTSVVVKRWPSWSWVSINHPVEYPSLEPYRERLPSDSDVVLRNDYREENVAAHPRRSTVLTINGLIKRGSFKKSSRSTSSRVDALFRPSGSTLDSHSLPCFLDDPDDAMPSRCYCLRVCEYHLVSPAVPPQSYYLVLERIQEEAGATTSLSHRIFGRFKRIGMGYTSQKETKVVFVNAERCDLELA